MKKRLNSGWIVDGDPKVIREIIAQSLLPEKTFKSGDVEITVNLVTEKPTKIINKRTGRYCVLPADQVDLYDLLIGTEKMLSGDTVHPVNFNGISPEELESLKKYNFELFGAIRNWFRENNSKAFFLLID